MGQKKKKRPDRRREHLYGHLLHSLLIKEYNFQQSRAILLMSVTNNQTQAD